jgi:hypothetical protein
VFSSCFLASFADEKHFAHPRAMPQFAMETPVSTFKEGGVSPRTHSREDKAMASEKMSAAAESAAVTK